METTKIFFYILTSIVGMGYVYSGKKTGYRAFILSGVLMMIFPYLISNAIAVIMISIVLIIGPFFARR